MTKEQAIKILKNTRCFDNKVGVAIDVAIKSLKERKQGKWICGEPCPCCGENRFKGLDADIYADWKPNFCPNCGADMRGSEND